MAHQVSTLADLRRYVIGDGSVHVGAGLAKIDITHNLLGARFPELTIALDETIAAVKARLARLAGTDVHFMQLMIMQNGKQPICMNEENRTLRSYGVQSHGTHIHIIDNDPNAQARNGELEDVSKVKKYVMSEEEYNKRENSVRAYKKKIRQQAQAQAQSLETEAKVQEIEQGDESGKIETDEEIEKRIQIGQRCEVWPGARRGKVRYVGKVPELGMGPERIWIGVEMDEPVGKHDGQVGSKRYMQTAPKCATFVKPALVKTGNYPERDPFDDDEEQNPDIMEEI